MQNKKTINVNKANITFLISALVYLCINFFVLAYFYTTKNEITKADNYILIVIIQIFSILIPSVILLKREGVKGFRLPSSLLSIQKILLIIVITILASISASYINQIAILLLSKIGEIPPDTIPFPTSIQELAASTVIIAMLPAFCEELLHRGVILGAYRKFGNTRVIIISGVFFGIFHMSVRNFFGPLVLGMLFAYFVIKTDSIYSSMIAHFTTNFFSVVLSFLLRNEYANQKSEVTTINMSAQISAFIIIILVLGIIVIGLLKVFNNVCKSENSEDIMKDDGINIINFDDETNENDYKTINEAIFSWSLIIYVLMFIGFVALEILSIAKTTI